MFSGVRSRMTYANVVATLAMVFAMSGGAYAASKFLITSTKQIKPSVLAALKGKTGANGAQGATGAPGPAGAQGPTGPKGDNGANGSNGVNGKGVVLGVAGTHCSSGGNSVEVEGQGSPQYICNGKNGQTGFTKTLPTGQTETGTIAWGRAPYSGGVNLQPISFNIPLENRIPEGNVILFTGASIPAHCKGNAPEQEVLENLEAEEGYMCIWWSRASGGSPSSIVAHDPENVEFLGTGRYGVSLRLEGLEPGSEGWGLWAVTAD